MFGLMIAGNTALHLSVMLGQKGNYWISYAYVILYTVRNYLHAICARVA